MIRPWERIDHDEQIAAVHPLLSSLLSAKEDYSNQRVFSGSSAIQNSAFLQMVGSHAEAFREKGRSIRVVQIELTSRDSFDVLSVLNQLRRILGVANGGLPDRLTEQRIKNHVADLATYIRESYAHLERVLVLLTAPDPSNPVVVSDVLNVLASLWQRSATVIVVPPAVDLAAVEIIPLPRQFTSQDMREAMSAMLRRMRVARKVIDEEVGRTLGHPPELLRVGIDGRVLVDEAYRTLHSKYREHR